MEFVTLPLMAGGTERVDVCEEAAKQRKSSVEQGEVGGFSVMARLKCKPQPCSCLPVMFPHEMSQQFVRDRLNSSVIWYLERR